jgi:hypothetical protein
MCPSSSYNGIVVRFSGVAPLRCSTNCVGAAPTRPQGALQTLAKAAAKYGFSWGVGCCNRLS